MMSMAQVTGDAAPSATSLAQLLAQLDPAARDAILADFPADCLAGLEHDWRFWARPDQLPPLGDWAVWLVLAGRGFGKTRMGAEWVRHIARQPGQRIALIGGSMLEARAVMIEGESGLLGICPARERPHFEPSRRLLTWPNGSVAQIYSGDEPDQLRGPQHHAAWVDELAKFHAPAPVWANLMMGLRLGVRPRALVTTTPRPIDLLRHLLADPHTAVTRGATWANAAHLPEVFLREMRATYSGTRLGAQELNGEILDDLSGALWTHQMVLDAHCPAAPPAFERVVVAIDPPVTAHASSDACGIIVAARGVDGHAYVLADASLERARPDEWARQALAVFAQYKADRLVAEVNQGGDLVESVLKVHQPDLPYKSVHASRGKIARAEPVAALYERGRVHHVGGFKALEAQMTQFTPGSSASPDRLDALVWALTDLMLGVQPRPAIRRF